MGAELIPMAFTTGWGSGINAYAVVLVLGLADKIWDLSQIPNALARTDVLVGAAILFAVEMLADKIPYVDSVWDSVHTVVRPAVGATIGYLIGHETAEPRRRHRRGHRRRHGPHLARHQGRAARRRQHLARAGEQHRRQHDRGRHASPVSPPSPSRTRGGRRPSRSCCSSSAPSSSTRSPVASAATSGATTPGASAWASPRPPAGPANRERTQDVIRPSPGSDPGRRSVPRPGNGSSALRPGDLSLGPGAPVPQDGAPAHSTSPPRRGARHRAVSDGGSSWHEASPSKEWNA